MQQRLVQKQSRLELRLVLRAAVAPWVLALQLAQVLPLGQPLARKVVAGAVLRPLPLPPLQPHLRPVAVLVLPHAAQLLLLLLQQTAMGPQLLNPCPLLQLAGRQVVLQVVLLPLLCLLSTALVPLPAQALCPWMRPPREQLRRWQSQGPLTQHGMCHLHLQDFLPHQPRSHPQTLPCVAGPAPAALTCHRA